MVHSEVDSRSFGRGRGYGRGSSQNLGVVGRTLTWKQRIGIMITVAPMAASLTVSHTPFSIYTANVDPGDGMPGSRVVTSYVGQYSNDADCRMAFPRRWIDSRGIEWQLASPMLKYDKGIRTVTLTINIPMDASPGTLKLDGNIVWACNWWERLFPGSADLPDLYVTVTR